jgi:hypothetical protein
MAASKPMSPIALLGGAASLFFRFTDCLGFGFGRGGFLFDPHYIIIAVPFFAFVWVRCRRSSHREVKIIAKTIQPWLVGMTIVAVSFFAVSRWLPRAEWSWIFFAEKAASWCEIYVGKFLPEGVAMHLILLGIFFTLNLLGSNWKN